MSEVIVTGKDGSATNIAKTSDEQFRLLTEMIAENLAPLSQRVYRHTYGQWSQFAAQYRLDPFDLNFEHFAAFLNGRDLAGATRRSWKAHMLRMLDWLEESPTGGGEWYAVQRRRLLKFLKGARMESAGGNTAKGR